MLDGSFAEGQTISYSLEAANKGNVDLTRVEITDDLPGPGALSCTPAQPVALLAVDAAINCDASYTITAADVTAGSVSYFRCAQLTQPWHIDIQV